MSFLRKLLKFFSTGSNTKSLSSKARKHKRMRNLIDNDPRLQEIDKEIEKIHSQYKIDPEFMAMLKKFK